MFPITLNVATTTDLSAEAALGAPVARTASKPAAMKALVVNHSPP
jgi:hypothetical protein